MRKQECASAKIPRSTVQTGSDEASYTLSDFILQNKIGSGSFGKVFKVKDKKTGKILVAKISIKKIEKDSISQLRNISQEVNILSKLNHQFSNSYIIARLTSKTSQSQLLLQNFFQMAH